MHFENDYGICIKEIFHWKEMKPCVKMYFMRRIRKMISLKFMYFTSLRIQFYTKENIKGDGKPTVTFIYLQYKFN